MRVSAASDDWRGPGGEPCVVGSGVKAKREGEGPQEREKSQPQGSDVSLKERGGRLARSKEARRSYKESVSPKRERERAKENKRERAKENERERPQRQGLLSAFLLASRGVLGLVL